MSPEAWDTVGILIASMAGILAAVAGLVAAARSKSAENSAKAAATSADNADARAGQAAGSASEAAELSRPTGNGFVTEMRASIRDIKGTLGRLTDAVTRLAESHDRTREVLLEHLGAHAAEHVHHRAGRD